MAQSGSISRRRWLVLGGAAVAVGGVGWFAADLGEAEPGRNRVRTDVAPLLRLFSAVGPLSDPHWLDYNPNDSGRELLPDQDPQLRVVGVAHLPEGSVAAVVGVPAFGFDHAEPTGRPKSLERFLPSEARWMHSAAFDVHVTNSRYQGAFYVDRTTDSLYFDAMNPVPLDGVQTP
ncbi:hypothetical protein [Yinghuangia sp. YIM S10712]|uniref:hypothetical protein n=1 Tax=Yinghuangia sp. YIM S10712 TaxID=3436930 RepID=UPI003F539252